MLITDTHCHLEAITDNNQYSDSALVPSVNLNDIPELIKIRYNNKFYKIGFGIHPWFINPAINSQSVYEELLKRCIENKPDFIGEIGLDQLKPDFSYQLELFKLQLGLAEKLAIPVVIHCVKAYNEVLQIVKQYKVTGIMHGFNANHIIANQFIEAGFLIGVGGLATKNSHIGRDIGQIPLNKIVFETDAPFMPVFEFAKSKLSDIFLYAQIVAHKYNLNLIDVVKSANKNVQQLFRN